MSVILQTTTTARHYRVRGTNGLPPPVISSTYKLYGPASAYNGTTSPVTLDPIQTVAAPTYDAVTGIVTADVSNSSVVELGGYREIWAVDVVGRGQIVNRPVLVVGPEAQVISRLEARHAMAQLVDDLWLGSLTSSTSGAGTTAVDIARTEGPDKFWVPADLYVYAGTGKGILRRVTGWVQSTKTFTVPAWPPVIVPLSGDLYELHKAFTIEDYHWALNQAIRDCAIHNQLAILDDTWLQTSDTQLEYVLPPGLTCVSRVWTKDATDADSEYTELLAMKKDNSLPWELLQGSRLLRFAATAIGTRIRVQSMYIPDFPVHDDDLIAADPTYLVKRGAAHLATRKLTGQGLDREGWAARTNLLHAQAESAKPDMKLLPGARLP